MQRLISAIKEFGPFSGMLYLLDRALGKLARGTRLVVYDLMVQPLDAPSLRGSERAMQAYRHRRLLPGDPRLEETPVPREVITSRFEQGAVCFATFKGAEFVGYIWLAFGSYEEDEIRCLYRLHPPLKAAFDFDLYIFPKFRLSRAFIAIWQGAAAELYRRGIDRSFSRITRFNLASRRAHLRLGSSIVGKVFALKLGRLECTTATVPPYFAVTRTRRVSLKVTDRSSQAPLQHE